MKTLCTFFALTIYISSIAQSFDIVTSEPLYSNNDKLNVKGRNGLLIKQKMSFGNYRTTLVKRSAIREWIGVSGFPNFIWTEHVDGKQTIRFNLTNGTDTSHVFTLSQVSSRDLVIGSNPNALPNVITSVMRIGTENQQNNFSAAIYTSKNEDPWELFLDNTNTQLHRQDYIGYIIRGQEYYSIVPVWKLERKGRISDMPFGAAGFEVRNLDGKAIAAVSLMDNGRVYMGQVSAQEQFLMANVCAALLLQSNIAQ